VKIAGSIVKENDFLTADVMLKQRAGHLSKESIILFHFDNKIYAYLNRCMHMQKPLNCQQEAIFDRTRRKLRCSMHGFIFEPESGVCISPVCEGQSLQKIKLIEQDGLIGLHDKQAKMLAVYRNGTELL